MRRYYKVLRFSHFTLQVTRKYETYLITSETITPGGEGGQGGVGKVRGGTGRSKGTGVRRRGRGKCGKGRKGM